ncbi:hypothetical protein CHARACLAT_011247 [Characodon lateralis]|uniref:Uncharacterized protein n=1 Tax=Characodon lateralis TaxID=208331 RepID=A0ABU7CZL4_9TELE|nr:hypothetical protein [Characodon lateralis]
MFTQHWLQRFRSSCTGLTEGKWIGSTALHSRTAGLCAEQGSPLSGQEHGSEKTAASVSLRQVEPFSWLGLCELQDKQHEDGLKLRYWSILENDTKACTPTDFSSMREHTKVQQIPPGESQRAAANL